MLRQMRESTLCQILHVRVANDTQMTLRVITLPNFPAICRNKSNLKWSDKRGVGTSITKLSFFDERLFFVMLRNRPKHTNIFMYIHCRQSLWRWRRMHTRASVEDLKRALLAVRRKDIVDLVEEDITRRANKPSIPSPAFRTVRFPKLHA